MRREAKLFISLLFIAVAGYLVIGYLVGSPPLTQSQIDARRAQVIADFTAGAKARQEENSDCLKRYEDMVAAGEMDPSKLCGPPTRQPEAEPTTFQKILDAAKRLILGTPALFDTKDTSWTR